MKIVVALYKEIPEWKALSSEFEGVDIVFAETADRIAEEIPDADAMFILAPNYSAQIAEIVKTRAKKLKWIQTTTVGVDEVMINGIPPGVILTKAMGVFDANVAEQAMGLILGFIRQIAASESDRQKNQYNRALRMSKTGSLECKNVGIVGYGGIGRKVSKRAKAFDTHVLVYDVVAGLTDENVDEFYLPGQFEDFIKQCDVVILTLPLTNETQYMFNRDTFKLMKKNSLLINVSRGKIVKESDLIEALKNGTIAGAGLDVFEEEPLPLSSELWKMENVVMTPHVGGLGDRIVPQLADLFRINISKFLKNEQMKYVVDLTKGF